MFRFPPMRSSSISPEDDNRIIVGFRPENLERAEAGAEYTIPVKVTLVEELGSDAYIYGNVLGHESEVDKFGSGDGSDQVVIRIPPASVPEADEVIHAQLKPGTGYFFSQSTGNALNRR